MLPGCSLNPPLPPRLVFADRLPPQRGQVRVAADRPPKVVGEAADIGALRALLRTHGRTCVGTRPAQGFRIRSWRRDGNEMRPQGAAGPLIHRKRTMS